MGKSLGTIDDIYVRPSGSNSKFTRALLGLVRPLPSAGGAGPPSISGTKRRGGKIQPAMERPGQNISDKV